MQTKGKDNHDYLFVFRDLEDDLIISESSDDEEKISEEKTMASALAVNLDVP